VCECVCVGIYLFKISGQFFVSFAAGSWWRKAKWIMMCDRVMSRWPYINWYTPYIFICIYDPFTSGKRTTNLWMDYSCMFIFVSKKWVSIGNGRNWVSCLSITDLWLYRNSWATLLLNY